MSMARGGTPYIFNSASSSSHTITHNRKSLNPLVVVINSSTNEIITPEEVTIINENMVEISFPVPVAIRGKIV